MKRHSLVATTLICLALVGCASYKAARQARTAETAGNWDQAVELYLDLLAEDPGNLEYKAGLLRSKLQASRVHFANARKLHDAGAFPEALREYQRALELDPTNDYARVEVKNTLEELANQRAREQGKPTIDELKEKARAYKSEPPTLNPRSKEPISLNFPNPVDVRDIYEALGKAFGINVIFDPDLTNSRLSLELKDVTAQDALEMLVRAAGHFYKVVDEHTILVADDTAQNRAKYEDLMIQTFFLSNADTKDVALILRSLLGARNVASNDQLNAIVLRDTADKVKVAQKIIDANDKARGEVVVDVELLQIDVNKLRQLGLSLSSYQIGTTFEGGGDLNSGQVRLSDAEQLGNRANWIATVPSVLYDFLKDDSDVQFLARPELRISDGEKAVLHIGDKVPIPVTTFNTGQTIGGNIVPITSFQYQDVGIRIEIEPRIHHNQEITLKLKVEVSNLAGTVQGSQGTAQPIISTRAIESTIRLRDGETNMLAGLIQTTREKTKTGVPGFSEIPVLGRLFSKNRTSRKRTDLVLTMTPHIIRTANITDDDLKPIWVGTQSNISFRGGSPSVESGNEGPFDETRRSPEEIRELIRERLRALSKAQQQQQPEGEQNPEGKPGEELVSPSPPSDIFAQPQPPASEKQPPKSENVEPQGQDNDNGDASDNQASLPGRPTVRPVAWHGQGRWVLVERRRSTEGGNDPGSTALPSIPAQGAHVQLAGPPGGVIRKGDDFTVTLQVAASSPVAHVPVTLYFDPQRLQATSVDAGDFLGGDGESTLLSDTATPGRVVIGASRLGSIAGVSGAGAVARIHFKALKDGPAKIGFRHLRVLDNRLHPLAPVEASGLELLVVDEIPTHPRPQPRHPEA
jgi:general secretion pathway protein D